MCCISLLETRPTLMFYSLFFTLFSVTCSYRLWVPAYDGVEVPLSLVYRLDSFGRNGLNPALLLVYGAYGTKYDPEFDSRLLSLLDRGG